MTQTIHPPPPPPISEIKYDGYRKPTVQEILEMSDNDLKKVMLRYPYDRLGHDGNTWVIGICPFLSDYEYNIFIPIPSIYVREFYCRMLHKEIIDFSMNR